MATYLILNIAVLVTVAIAILWRKPVRLSKPWLVTLGVVLVLTLLFDNILILMGMYSYAADKILGVYVWLAPVEDFMYAFLAAILVPALWHKLGIKHAK